MEIDLTLDLISEIFFITSILSFVEITVRVRGFRIHWDTRHRKTVKCGEVKRSVKRRMVVSGSVSVITYD